MRILSLLLTTGILQFSWSQSQKTIEGQVFYQNGEVIPYANILVLDSTLNQHVLKTNSNENGVFLFSLDANTIKKSKFIYATSLGISSDTLEIDSDSKLEITIPTDGIVSLNEVEVVGTSASLTRKADRFIFTPTETIKKGTTALNIIKITPLIDYDIKTDFFSIINRQATTVTINNRKSNMPREMITSLLKSTPSESIKNIEIITNPGSEYGANTTGGIININLKNNFTENFSGFLNLSSEQANYNTTVFNGAINYSKNKLTIKFSPFLNNSYNYHTSQIRFDSSNDQSQQTDNFYKRNYDVYGGGVGVDYYLSEKSLLSFNGFYSYVDGDSRTENSTLYLNNLNQIDSILSSPIVSADQHIYNFGNLFYEQKFDSLGTKSLTFNLDYNFQNDENEDNGLFQNTFPEESQPEIYQNTFPKDFTNISARIDYSTQKSNAARLTYGIQYSSSSFDNALEYRVFDPAQNELTLNPSLSNQYSYKEDYYAGYLEKTKNIGDKINLRLGLRIEATDYNSENKTIGIRADSSYVNIFPNLSISYTPKEGRVYSMALSKKIKRPSIELLLPGRTYINPNYYTEKNPFLQPVIAYNGEAMFSLKNIYFFTLGYDYMDNEYGQFLLNTSEDGVDMQNITYLNYGESHRGYFQFYTRHNLFNKFLSTNFSTSINYSDYKTAVENINGNFHVNNLNFSVFFNNTLFFSREKNFIGFANMRYISKSETFAIENKRSLFRTDIGIRKNMGKFSLLVYFSDVSNSYGKAVTSIRSTQNSIFNEQIKNEYLRSITLSLRYSFGNTNLRTKQNQKSANEDIKNRLN